MPEISWIWETASPAWQFSDITQRIYVVFSPYTMAISCWSVSVSPVSVSYTHLLILIIHSVFYFPLNDTILQFGIIQDFYLLRNDRVQLVSSYSKNPLFSRISGVSTPNNVSSGCVYFLLFVTKFVTKIVIIKSHAQ